MSTRNRDKQASSVDQIARGTAFKLRRDLATQAGAGLVGANNNVTVQEAIDAHSSDLLTRATTAALTTEQNARIAGDDALDVRVDTLESTMSTGRRIEKTWAALNAIVGAEGDVAEVPTSDAGTHTDPVVGGTVNNAGVFRYETSAPAGWERIGDNDVVSASASATAAASSAADADADRIATEAAATDIADNFPTGWKNSLAYPLVDARTYRWNPTYEIMTYDEDTRIHRRTDGSPLATVYDTFDGDAGVAVSARPMTHWHLAGGPTLETSWMRYSNSAFLKTNGDGTASLSENTGAGTASIGGLALTPSGCGAWIGRIIFSNSGSEVSGVFLGRGTGRDLAGTNTTPAGALQIVEKFDGVSALQVRQSEAITGWNAANENQTVVVFSNTVAGIVGSDPNIVSTRHIGSSQEIYSVVSLLQGHLAGISVRNIATKLHEVEIIPLDMNAGLEVVDGYIDIGKSEFAAQPDCDIADLRTIDGEHYAVYGTSINVAAGSAEVQGPASVKLGKFNKPGQFIAIATLDENANKTTADRINKNEGAAVVLIDDIIRVATVDQSGSDFFVYSPKSSSDLTIAPWLRGQINTPSRPNGQSVFAHDIDRDGEEELIFAFEGSVTGTNVDGTPVVLGSITNGGVVIYKLTSGESPLLAASWTEYIITKGAGAWSFAKHKHFIDFDEDGVDEMLIVGHRDGFRNTDGLGMVAGYTPPAGGALAGEWTRTVLWSGADVLQTAICEAGSGTGKDIAFTRFDSANVTFLQFPSWTVTTHTLPTTTDPYSWQLVPLPNLVNDRTAFHVVMGESVNGGTYLMYWDGAAWQHELLQGHTYGHPNDKPVAPVFELTPGILGVYYSDSGGNNGHVHRFLDQRIVRTIEAPAITATADADLDALVAAMTVAPSDARIELMRTLILRMKAAGSWTLLDFFYDLGMETAQGALLDWRDPTRVLTPIGHTFADNWVASRGWTGDGVDDTLNIGYDPAAASRGFALDSAHLSSLSRTDTSAGVDIGSVNNTTRLIARSGASVAWSINRSAGGSETIGAGNVPTVPLIALANRTANNNTDAWVNGRKVISSANASATLASGLYIGSNSSSLFCTRQLLLIGGGSKLTSDTMTRDHMLAQASYASSIAAWKP